MPFLFGVFENGRRRFPKVFLIVLKVSILFTLAYDFVRPTLTSIKEVSRTVGYGANCKARDTCVTLSK